MPNHSTTRHAVRGAGGAGLALCSTDVSPSCPTAPSWTIRMMGLEAICSHNWDQLWPGPGDATQWAPGRSPPTLTLHALEEHTCAGKLCWSTNLGFMFLLIELQKQCGAGAVCSHPLLKEHAAPVLQSTQERQLLTPAHSPTRGRGGVQETPCHLSALPLGTSG